MTEMWSSFLLTAATNKLYLSNYYYITKCVKVQ